MMQRILAHRGLGESTRLVDLRLTLAFTWMLALSDQWLLSVRPLCRLP